MDNVIVLNQNVKLASLSALKDVVKPGSDTMILSTQFVFENEVELIDSILECKCVYKNFSDILDDAELEACDKDAFDVAYKQEDLFYFYECIQNLKNIRLAQKFLSQYSVWNKIIVSDGLGIRVNQWKKLGFKYISLEYYYVEPNAKINILSLLKKIFRRPYNVFSRIKKAYATQIHIAFDKNEKYLFYGNLNRIGYRINLKFREAGLVEHIKYMLNLMGIVWKNKTIRLSSFHEGFKTIPDRKALNVKLIQDGYLPPNYSSNYLYFYGHNTEFYTWDEIGCNTFRYHHLPYRIMPIRNLLFLPENFKFPTKVKKILCASSGTGDWTAVKNRSDDDRLVWAIGKVAAMFPDIEFIYRCHPTWIHPAHAGVNSINRCVEYISWLNLPNFKMSCNIPPAIQNGHFVLSYKRSSFEEDLKEVDLVLGEHSVAMLDAGFKGIPFASCNMTGHRAFFKDINDLGFPHCETVEEIANLINTFTSEKIKEQYRKAIINYNKMTEIV